MKISSEINTAHLIPCMQAGYMDGIVLLLNKTFALWVRFVGLEILVKILFQ